MDKQMQIKIKAGTIEIEVAGEQEAVKEQFELAVAMVRDIHNMQMATGKDAVDDMFGKLLAPLLEDLKK